MSFLGGYVKRSKPLLAREMFRKTDTRVFVQKFPCEICGRTARWRFQCKGPVQGTEIVHDYCDKHSKNYKVQKY